MGLEKVGIQQNGLMTLVESAFTGSFSLLIEFIVVEGLQLVCEFLSRLSAGTEFKAMLENAFSRSSKDCSQFVMILLEVVPDKLLSFAILRTCHEH